MDLRKIGTFLKELRKEKGLTQEQLAEQFYVSGRTVSRWETGSNLPDLDLLVRLSDFYELDLREILDGERKTEKMNQELEDTVRKVADYSNERNSRTAKIVRIYFILGGISLIINTLLRFFELPDTFWLGFIEGATVGLAFVAMLFGFLYANGSLQKLAAEKRRLLGFQEKGNQRDE